MKLMKWLKRDRSDRRCSDSHVAMVTSPYDEKYGRNHSLNGADPIRTKEYLQALSEFRARRSLGLNINFDKKFDASPERNKKASLNNEEHRSKSDQKPKRKSLPETCSNSHMLSQTLPQIQFLFSNQIFMPGNRPQNKRRNRKQKTTSDKTANKLPTKQAISPDFPRLKQSYTDFDADDSESPSSPPPNFFKDSSLPYIDKDATMPLETSKSNSSEREAPLKNINSDRSSSGTRESQKPLLNSNSSPSEIYATIRRLSESSSLRADKARVIKAVIEELSNYDKDQTNATDLADTSIDSITRKLEEKCHIHNKILTKGHFRGVPLVKRSTLKISKISSPTDNKHSYAGEGLTRAHWNTIPVTLRGTLDVEYTARDVDILSSVHHPNILLLMGITYDTDHKIECVFEECSATLYDLLYEQKLHLTLNTCIEYLSDIANAASHLYNSGYVHTAVSSHTIVITSKGVAKLFGFELCSRLLTNDSGNSPKGKKKCEPYKLMYSSPEPEYENLKGRLHRSSVSDSNQNASTQYDHQCSPQVIDERELLAHFRWQAPELFDDVDKRVTPTKTTDVYSICLVLWECINGVMPWSTLSYKHLSDLYLLWQTGIRLKDGRYPILIQDILTDGLSLDAEDRMSIKDLCAKLAHVKNYIHFGSDCPIGDTSDFKINTDLDKSDPFSDHGEQFECEETSRDGRNITSSLHNIMESTNASKQQDTNMATKVPISLNLSSIRLSESRGNLDDTDTSEEMSPEQDMTMHKTDSTEYCSLLTPDVRKFASRLQDASVSLQPSKLSFDESLREIPENSLQEKIMRLNSNFTPKSYKSLEIKTPPIEKLQDLSKFTKRVGSADCEKRSKYYFDIKNTSLPNTPIARNTKIRKYAWLSGEDEEECLGNRKNKEKETNSQAIQTDSLNDSLETRPKIDVGESEHNTSKGSMMDEDITKPNIDARDTVDATPFVVQNDVGRNSMYRELSTSTLCTDRKPFRRGFFGPSKSLTPNLSDKFRSRSQSWGSRSRVNMRGSENNVTGVDIRPLVAIHEKWIEEAKQKHNRSLSLPDNYRGSAHAVKPASHRVDPVLPYNPNDKSHSFVTAKKTFKKRSPPKGHYQNIPNPVRAAIAKKITVFPKLDDFFENSLWKKEKDKCQVLSSTRNESNPQSSSTPYKNKSVSDSTTQTDQATNTDTFEELCETIIRQMKEQGFFNMFEKPESRFSSLSPTIHIRSESEGKQCDKPNKSVLAELCETFQNNDNTETQPNNIEISKVIESNPANLSNMEVHQNVHMIGCKNMKNLLDCENNQDEDCQSLPEIRGEVINKTLKRCQAFSALQTARSTEDMYIDDELSANNDIHALSDNMLLIPMHSSLHEALCDKANDCCLVKIKEESSNETILIVCDNSQRNVIRPKSASSTNSDSELESNDGEFSQVQNLRIEALPSMNLVDISTANQALSVIEEIPGEEELPDSDSNNSRNIQHLISLYENVNGTKYKNVTNASKQCKVSRANEISFLILDNMEECDENLPDSCDMKDSNELLVADSVIQDYIMI